MLDRVKELAKKYEAEMIDLRRYFHQNPELSWQETETTKRIVAELEKMGCKILQVGFGGTQSGVLAEIVGGKPGKCVALRADIDALPLQDEKDVPYKSKKPGVMHACGHDAHASMLLMAARILCDIKDELHGTVRLIFQPAEEYGMRHGARPMIEEGVLNGVDAIFGFHIWTVTESGVFEWRHGPIMAANAGWDLSIHGKGGHGSAPELAVDPSIAAARILDAFQTIISRELSPKDTAVISLGGMKTSSHVFNIIPERVEMTGCVRSFSAAVQEQISVAMARVVEGVCATHRCKADFVFKPYVPATVNDAACADILRDAAIDVLGADKVREAESVMGSEDFSMFLEKIPGSFGFMGCRSEEKKSTHPHHSPKFDVDESVMKNGAEIHVQTVLKFLNN